MHKSWTVIPCLMRISSFKWPVCSTRSSGCWTVTPSRPHSQRRVSRVRGLSAPQLLTVHHSEPLEPWNSSTPPAPTQASSRESKRGNLMHLSLSNPPTPLFILCFPLLNLTLPSFQRILSISTCLGSAARMKDYFVCNRFEVLIEPFAPTVLLTRGCLFLLQTRFPSKVFIVSMLSVA